MPDLENPKYPLEKKTIIEILELLEVLYEFPLTEIYL